MHPLYDSTTPPGDAGNPGDTGDGEGSIPRVYLDIAVLISDILRYRYVGSTEAELLFDAIACGLEACDVPHWHAELIRAQLRESTGRGDQ